MPAEFDYFRFCFRSLFVVDDIFVVVRLPLDKPVLQALAIHILASKAARTKRQETEVGRETGDGINREGTQKGGKEAVHGGVTAILR